MRGMIFSILKTVLAPVRWVMSALILIFDRTFVPRQVERSPEKQEQLDLGTRRLALYQMETCPFCVKVRRHVQRLGLKIEMRDVKRNREFNKELVREGGQFQVPCLRIEQEDGSVRWLYESDEINAYLNELIHEVRK